MLQFKLAIKNLIAAGLRTWLSVSILAASYLIIVVYNGVLNGWNEQAVHDSIHWEFGHGQLRHEDYDPFDPFSIQASHGVNPVENPEAVPVLVRQASVYPNGRMLSILLKGIPANQQLLELPTKMLASDGSNALRVVIGRRMAKTLNLGIGDKMLMRWRDKNGAFDAQEITIADVFKTDVPSVDEGNIWVSMENMHRMTELQGHATYVVVPEGFEPEMTAGWELHTLDQLLIPLREMLAVERATSAMIYLMLLGLAMLAIFDTQVLSIFRRQKEIGTYIALGMTRWQVVRLFTFEGSANSLLGAAIGAVIGTPLCIYLASNGIQLYDASQNMGVTISETIFPVFGVGLIVTTLVLVFMASLIVSFLPARKIARMDPTLALKGKVK